MKTLTLARQTKYEKIIVPKLPAIELWAKRGFTDTEISLCLGIAESTLNLYKIKHPEFKDFLIRCKLEADSEVVGSLYKRAVGFDYVEEHLEYTPGTGTAETKIKSVKKIKKFVAGDTLAAMYWLNNRQADKWRHKNKEKEAGQDEAAKYFGDMKEEDIKALCEAERKKDAKSV